jgi:hypothetical protein
MSRRTVTLVSLVLGVLLIMPAALAGGQSNLREARQSTAKFHSVIHAEGAGYESTLDLLGCFENPGVGGMGLHYVNWELMDGSVDARTPEALVYEMRADGKLKLAGLEYIVPLGAWEGSEPPELFGQHFHVNEALGLWVLHVWVWTPNPTGMFEDWNPSVALCPDGVPVFGA